MGGDSNMIENIPLDRGGGNPTTQHYGIEHLQNIKTNNNMIDIWRKQHPAKKEYTYMNNLTDFKSRKDHLRPRNNIQNKNKDSPKLTFRSPNDTIKILYKKRKNTRSSILEAKLQYPGK